MVRGITKLGSERAVTSTSKGTVAEMTPGALELEKRSDAGPEAEEKSHSRGVTLEPMKKGGKGSVTFRGPKLLK